jgi:hypothetical protein
VQVPVLRVAEPKHRLQTVDGEQVSQIAVFYLLLLEIDKI